MDRLEKVIKKKSYFNIYKSTYICFVAKEIIDKEINTKVDIEKYKNQVIKVRMQNPYLATEARMRKAQIIEKINQKIGKDVLKNIRFI